MCDIDDVLKKLGTWGRFHQCYYLCICFVVIFSVFPISYIFTARDINYRCLIPECDENKTEYNPNWLKDFVPYKEDIPSKCLRYASENNTCSAKNINKNETVVCHTFIYERQETTIVHDFNIHCDENLWKLTIVGTINICGEFICLLYTGYLSDRFGRRTVMIFNVLLSTCVGVLRSFSVSYIMFLVLELLDIGNSSMYGAAFILGMEILPKEQRNVGNSIICAAFVIGQVILGLAAWVSPTWRFFLRITYSTGLISIIFYWALPESVRWLISNGQPERAREVLTRIAKTNKKEIKIEEINSLLESYELESSKKDVAETKTEDIKNSFKSKVLVARLIFCSYVWICCNFLYYGLTIHSVSISDVVYLGFIFSIIIEIPGYLIYHFFNEKLGRRKLMFFAMVICGFTCVSIGFIPKEYSWLRIIFFLIGKCGSTVSYTVIYVYTTEIFPTCSRHTMFSICSMFGNFGTMTAPQIPLLARISQFLPLLMFGVLAVTAGFVTLAFPETLNTKLPDTIDEAVNIGRRKNIIENTIEEKCII